MTTEYLMKVNVDGKAPQWEWRIFLAGGKNFIGQNHGTVIKYANLTTKEVTALLASPDVFSVTKHPAPEGKYFGVIRTHKDFLQCEFPGFFQEEYIETFLQFDLFQAAKKNQPSLGL